MNKKNYQKPATQVVKINVSRQLLGASEVNSLSNNAELQYEGGGNGVARGRSFDDWDDEE